MKNPSVKLHSINDNLCESWTKSCRGETNLLDAIMTFVIPCLGLVTSAEFSSHSIPVQIIIALVVTILSATGYYYASRHLMGKKNCNRHRPRNVIRASEAATLINEIVAKQNQSNLLILPTVPAHELDTTANAFPNNPQDIIRTNVAP